MPPSFLGKLVFGLFVFVFWAQLLMACWGSTEGNWLRRAVLTALWVIALTVVPYFVFVDLR